MNHAQAAPDEDEADGEQASNGHTVLLGGAPKEAAGDRTMAKRGPGKSSAKGERLVSEIS